MFKSYRCLLAFGVKSKRIVIENKSTLTRYVTLTVHFGNFVYHIHMIGEALSSNWSVSALVVNYCLLVIIKYNQTEAIGKIWPRSNSTNYQLILLNKRSLYSSYQKYLTILIYCTKQS